MADAKQIRILVNAGGHGDVWIDGVKMHSVRKVTFNAQAAHLPEVTLHLNGVDVEIEAEAAVEVERD